MQSQPILHSRNGFEPLAAHVKLTDAKPDVLLFDLCGVLFDDTIWTRWLFQLVSRVGTRLCYDEFIKGWDERLVIDVNCGRREYWEAVQQYLESLDLSRAAADEICVAAKARRRQFDESIRPLPGTKTGLTKLAAHGHRMAVIGNVPYDTATVRQRISHLGLSEYFEEFLSSFDVGSQASPQSRYRCIAERLKATPQAILFISGSAAELRDAFAEGLSVIAWQLPQPLKAVHSIDQLHELLPVVHNGRHHSLAG
jgi:beta-phosphoglucomutase-like phosphatase (HAD superfamily)